MGTYPLNDELKLINEPVLTIWGTNDGVLDFSKFSTYKSNLPTISINSALAGRLLL